MEAMYAFIGCFAALAVVNEIHAENRAVRYTAALVCGMVATLLVGAAVNFISGLFHH